MLYLVKIFSEESDDNHYLTMPEIISKLAAYGVNADRKTIYQDIVELKRFGLDILTSQDGRNYYYYLSGFAFRIYLFFLSSDSRDVLFDTFAFSKICWMCPFTVDSLMKSL